MGLGLRFSDGGESVLTPKSSGDGTNNVWEQRDCSKENESPIVSSAISKFGKYFMVGINNGGDKDSPAEIQQQTPLQQATVQKYILCGHIAY